MTQKTSNVEKLVTGLGIAGAAAAAIAGGYFFYGKDGKKHRKNIKSWSIKAKAEVMDKLEKAKDLSEASYHDAIDLVAAKYSSVKSIAPEEVQLFARDLKKHWKDIKKEITPAPKKKAAKKTTSTK
jgi:gas vesicle protein